jgi:AraC-like DNA-binding protein
MPVNPRLAQPDCSRASLALVLLCDCEDDALVGLSDANADKCETLLKYTESVKQGNISPAKSLFDGWNVVKHRRHYDRLAEEIVDPIVSEYQAGSSVYELAGQFGCHRQTVSRHLKSRGVQMRGTALGKKQLEEAERLHASGLSLTKVAEHIGVDATTVRRQLRARKDVLRPPCVKPPMSS